MPIGPFNKRITIQSIQTEVDADGYEIEKVAEYETLWAMVKPISAKEYVSAKATKSENITRFVIRFRKDLKNNMTILYNGRNFEIESIINDDERNRTLTIIGREVVANV